MALSLGKKETRLVGGKAGRPKSALLEQAFKRASRLSRKRQDAIALQVLDTLRNKPDPAVERFQSLIENKYTRGLTGAENTELDRLEADFRKSDETFYGPIVERAKRLAAIPKPSLENENLSQTRQRDSVKNR